MVKYGGPDPIFDWDIHIPFLDSSICPCFEDFPHHRESFSRDKDSEHLTKHFENRDKAAIVRAKHVVIDNRTCFQFKNLFYGG